jgi:hypothetical protein
MHVKLICNLYALLHWQNFILVKSGCYSFGPKSWMDYRKLLSNFKQGFEFKNPRIQILPNQISTETKLR